MAKLNLSSIQTSKLALTPQLQNAIKLLQYSAIELNQEIQNIFESNPLIEKTIYATILKKMIVKFIILIMKTLALIKIKILSQLQKL